MPPKSEATAMKSILKAPSRIVSSPDQIIEGGEEIEIAAQISLPSDGGWGWVIVAATVYCVGIIDGIVFTFGSLLADISLSLDISDSLTALINSISLAVYLIASPLASSLINRFGFRACAMLGSVICSLSLIATYFITNYVALCFFYGAVSGFGCCLINMSSNLIVGFYFEKLRPVAISLTCCGTSLGIMFFNWLNVNVIDIAGWRTLILLYSGLFGSIYFVAMTFRPLLSLTVMQTTDDPTRTVTYLPNLSSVGLKATVAPTSEALKPNAAERLFNAVSNVHFPTAAAVVDEGGATSTSAAGPSAPAVSKLTLTAYTPQGGISRRQLKQVQSIVSRSNIQDKSKKNIEITIKVDEPPENQGCCGRFCRWDKHVPESRPMYRDDAFYQGDMEKLPAYQKSIMDTRVDNKTGLEYQLAVSRAATATDLQERRGFFTTAVRRVLATMLNPKLLKQKSFMLLAAWGFLTFVGVIVPFVYVSGRGEEIGIEQAQTALFVTIIGFASFIGRLLLGPLAYYVDPVFLLCLSSFMTGISTIVSNLSNNVYFQYGYCFTFGLFAAGASSLRSMVLVTIFGLENLTNATGMMLLFQGLGSLISTPLAGALKANLGINISFYTSGAALVLSAFCLIPVIIINKTNKKRITQPQTTPKLQQTEQSKKTTTNKTNEK